jgi:hypothetical protein
MKFILRFLSSARTGFCMVALLCASGCSAVYVSRPVGDRPHALVAADWNGVWVSDDNSPVVVLVTDAASGQLQIGNIEIKDDALTLKTETLSVRESGDRLYVNARDTHEGKDRYTWVSLKMSGEVAVFWTPDLEKFRTLVRTGKLKGTATDTGNVYVDALTAETLTAIHAGELGPVIDWEAPVTLRRLKR